MKTYEHVLETVELALKKGEYNFCIEFLSPIIESYSLSSKEGINLRTILITALCGINRKEDAKKFCKELLKSYDNRTRENAKYLMEIIDSPEIKKPENWNIKFETNTSLSKRNLNSINSKNIHKEEKKFINITDTPTGETKPFKKGFVLVISLILIFLIQLLSGCVKIENTIDLSKPDSINNLFSVESKYINKFPWQMKFEEQIKDINPEAEISSKGSYFSLKNKNLTLEKTKSIMENIQETAGNLAGGSTDIRFDSNETNYIFFKKHNYRIDLNLQSISEVKDLELNFKIIHPNKAIHTSTNNNKLETSKNLIVWNLIPGQINTLEFSFWSWNKLIIGVIFIFLISVVTYFLRFYRFKLGTDLPQLPPN